MDAIQRELLREQILQTAHNARPNAVTVPILRMYARRCGFPKITEDEIKAEVDYLVDKKDLAPVEKHISPENKAWRITAAGIDFLAEKGLA